MYESLTVYTNRTNVVPVGLGYDISAETFESEIREDESPTSNLIATWVIEFRTDGTDGELLLTLDNSQLTNVQRRYAFMDIKRISNGEPLSVFKEPIRIYFQGAVTA